MLQQILNADIAPPPSLTKSQGWTAGYFFGWSNPGFSEPMDFYLDDIDIQGVKITNLTVQSNQTGSVSTSPFKPPVIIKSAIQNP
jgi:hypothetical protein